VYPAPISSNFLTDIGATIVREVARSDDQHVRGYPLKCSAEQIALTIGPAVLQKQKPASLRLHPELIVLNITDVASHIARDRSNFLQLN